MKTEIPNIEDSARIADLHKEGIPTGFISSMHKAVITRLYRHIIKHEIIFVVKKESVVIAFISCAINTRRLYTHFIASNFFQTLPYLFWKIFSKGFIVNIIETLRAPFKTKIKNSNSESPELLSIVVANNYQTGGLGKLLLDTLEYELKTRGIMKYKVIAGDQLESANRFYIKTGFTLAQTIKIHNNAISNVYIKALNNN